MPYKEQQELCHLCREQHLWIRCAISQVNADCCEREGAHLPWLAACRYQESVILSGVKVGDNSVALELHTNMVDSVVFG